MFMQTIKAIFSRIKEKELTPDYVALNHIKVFVRIMFRATSVDFSTFRYQVDRDDIRATISIDGQDITLLYSENDLLDSSYSTDYNFIISSNSDLDFGFRSHSFKVVKNWNSSIRWIFPKSKNMAYLFNVYSTTAIKKVMINMFINIPIIRDLVLDDYVVHISPDYESLIDAGNFDVIYAGIVGAHQKIVVYNSAASLQYLKLPIGELATSSLHCEFEFLGFISNSCARKFVPNSKRQADGIAVAKLFGSIDSKARYGDCHHEFIENIATVNFQKHNVSLLTEAKKFHNTSAVNYSRPSHRAFNKLACRYSAFDFCCISTSFAHGDFTPWNVVIRDDTLGVFDWEMGLREAPLYFDFFHYIYYSSVLVDHLNFDKIKHRIDALQLQYFMDMDDKDFNKYHFLYIYIQSFRHLEALYHSADEPVIQSSWLIEVWIAALEYFKPKYLEI